MPDAGGLAATRIISADLPDVRVVVLTASEDDADLFEAIKSGAQGFLPKDIEAQRLFELLDGVIRGEPALTPGLARKLLDEFAQPDTCLLYTSDAADERSSVDLGGRPII